MKVALYQEPETDRPEPGSAAGSAAGREVGRGAGRGADASGTSVPPAARRRVHCLLCPQGCRIKDGAPGICRVRVNHGGTLYASSYARCTSVALDPIEKKPLYHFYPGATVFSLGSLGCNLGCGFCQNWTISQADAATVALEPAEAVRAALAEAPRHCVGIAYTYSEPLVWYEYVLDTARAAHDAGLVNVLVTNGYINEGPLLELLPHIDALNVDVKAFTADFYRKNCLGRLAPVLRTVELAVKQGCLVEVTNLLIPGENDSPAEVAALVGWLSGLGRGIPLHFSRYFPNHRFTIPATPHATLLRAREQAREKLDYVYLGNVWADGAADTRCPSCGNTLITRAGFVARAGGLRLAQAAEAALEATVEQAAARDAPRYECAACGAEAAVRGVVVVPVRRSGRG